MPASLSTKKTFPRFVAGRASDLQVLLLIGAAFFIQLVVFFIFNRGASVNYAIFWPSYSLWALFAFLTNIRKNEPRRRTRQSQVLFGLLLLLTSGLSNISSPFVSISLAFEGFFLGLAFYGAGVIIKKHWIR
jgi:hypothetical protein